MAVLTPSYLLYSTVAMTESTLLAFTTAGLLLAERNAVGGGVLLGYGGLTPFRVHVPVWKIVYIWMHVFITVGGCLLLARQALDVKEPDRNLALLGAPWLVGNTLFVFTVGQSWGFHEFHRYILPALPPLLWAYRRYFPTRVLSLTAVVAGSFALAPFAIPR